MNIIDEEQLKLEISHIFESGANEVRVFNMVKSFVESKEVIFSARNMSVSDMIEAGITVEELYENGDLTKEYYTPSNSKEYFDGTNFYNLGGDKLRDLSEYDTHAEGYTPFGDE
ncbi:MAG: hypothetical protein GX587_08790 [Bacteroidales bacterium]|nr:hypothetical protein [Bacteroidales bacterium]